MAASASLKSSLARADVSRLAADNLTGLHLSSFAGIAADLEADAEELDAAAELSGISDFFCPFVGIALAESA